MEQETVWTAKLKYALIVGCLVLVGSAVAYAKISSGNASKNTIPETAQVRAGEMMKTERAVNTLEAAPEQKTIESSAKSGSSSNVVTNGQVFASKNGSKYYPVGCKSGNIVKEENKITFSSGAEAETAGYTLAKNCQKKQ